MRAAEAGQLPADIDAALATQGLHALMVGIMHEWVLDPTGLRPRGAAPAVGGHVHRGVARTPRAHLLDAAPESCRDCGAVD